MGNIVLLDEATINKIAAGEVVDRPSSIVKELVENSLDAGAKKIIVEIKNGGISFIKITDNGKGFESDDMVIAFERHATSKIRREEDLQTVKSMGFRGEALASVAAISKVTLISKNINESVGKKVIVEAGNLILEEEYATSTGTIIEIRDVFYNVPARFKFLKKDYTEAGYIEDVITRLALANPDVALRLISNNKEVLSTRGTGNIKDAVYDIFGREVYNNLIEVDYDYNMMKVKGVIGKPVISRSTRAQQFTFINLRYVKDKVISSAIDRACLQKYAIGKYAFAVLNLDINPKHVDVNVHPAKLEVKFDNEGEVFEAIYHAVKNSLEVDSTKTNPFSILRDEKKEDVLLEKNDKIVKTVEEKNDIVAVDQKVLKPLVIEEKITEVANVTNNTSIDNKNDNREIVEEINEANFEKKNLTLEQKISEIKKEELEIKRENEIQEKSPFVAYVAEDNQKDIYQLTSEVKKEENKSEEMSTDILEDKIEQSSEKVYYKYVGHIFDTYIIIQKDEKIYMIDQHAAHERFLYEKIKKDYFSKKSNTQMLLLPILVELSKKELDIVNENIDIFKNAGYELENFGVNSIKISGVPNIGYELDYKGVFLDTIDEIMGASKTHREEREERFIATLACKAAVKGNMKISYEEQISLIGNMLKLDNPFNCPHGRPTAIEYSRYEIERKFLRK